MFNLYGSKNYSGSSSRGGCLWPFSANDAKELLHLYMQGSYFKVQNAFWKRFTFPLKH